MGWIRPPLEQYLTFLSNLIRGDFGYSLKYVGQSVNGIIAQTFPVSAQLGLQAYLLSFPIGIFFGIIAARAAGPSPGLCSGGLLRAGRVGAGIYSGIPAAICICHRTGVVPGGPVEGLCLHHPAHTDPGHRLHRRKNPQYAHADAGGHFGGLRQDCQGQGPLLLPGSSGATRSATPSSP